MFVPISAPPVVSISYWVSVHKLHRYAASCHARECGMLGSCKRR
jgi:hypothetical protein